MHKGMAALAVAFALGGCKKDESASPPAKAADAAAKPSAAPDASTAPADATVIASAFISHLAAGEWDAAHAMYPPKVADKVKIEDLQGIAKQIGLSGAPDSVTATPDPGDPTWLHVEARFPGGALADESVRVVKGYVLGIVPKAVYTAPDYVDPSGFDERAIVVGTGTKAVPGILCVPHGQGPFPVVVLVQGSGPSDLDEYAGDIHIQNIAPFRDLAEGVASRGVAVLRFDKATEAIHALARGLTNTNHTVKDEYFDPLTDALALVAATPDIDPKRIFLLGHSEAGWLTPWMLRDHPELAGGIIASGDARHLGDISIDQDQYLYKLQAPGITDDQLAQLKAIDEAKAKRTHDPDLAEDTPSDQLPIGISAHYWRFLATYDAPAVIATIEKPLLILQGGRDYNVTMIDLDMWKKALAGRDDVTVKVYPDLSHEYLTGKGTSNPTEMMEHGHVDKAVVEDIAAWVKARH